MGTWLVVYFRLCHSIGWFVGWFVFCTTPGRTLSVAFLAIPMILNPLKPPRIGTLLDGVFPLSPLCFWRY